MYLVFYLATLSPVKLNSRWYDHSSDWGTGSGNQHDMSGLGKLHTGLAGYNDIYLRSLYTKITINIY